MTDLSPSGERSRVSRVRSPGEPLRNAKFERVAWMRAAGLGAVAAVKATGKFPTISEPNARRLCQRTDIRQRVEEIMLDGARQAGATAGGVLQELARIGFANMHDLMKIGEDGQAHPVLDPSRPISRDMAAAVQELSYDSKGRPRVKMHAKESALTKIGEYVGILKNQSTDVSLTVNQNVASVYNLTDEQLLAIASAGGAGTAAPTQGEN